MAINFPATAGQPTNGSYTYNVAGLTYSWDGSSWNAAGAGASATDTSIFSVTTNSAGTPALSYNTGTGVFSYTPPDLSSYLTAEADTLATVTGRGNTTTTSLTTDGGSFICQIGPYNEGFYLYNGNSTHLGISWSSSASRNRIKGTGSHPLWFEDFSYVRISPSSTYVRLDYGESEKLKTLSTGVEVTGALTAGGLTYPTTNGNSGDVLTSNGSGDVTWQTPVGLQARTTPSVTQSIANGASANVSIVTPKGYALYKIQTSHAAWVTLYSDTSSRTADASRSEFTDPTPGSGVLAEVITGGSATQLITPATVCFNSSGSNTTYAKIVNKSGSTVNLTVTLTLVGLEA